MSWLSENWNGEQAGAELPKLSFPVSDANYDDPSYKQKHCAGFQQAEPGEVREEHPAGPEQKWDVLHAGPDQVQEHKD